MLSPRVLRSLLLALAVVVTTGVAARAPQALRASVDPASEVCRAHSSRAPRAVTAERRSRHTQPSAFPPHGFPQLAARWPHASLFGTRAWPGAHAGRDVLALKSSRLI